MNQIINRRKKRVRAKINGTSDRPRLSVFRSLKSIYAQIIDDETGKTIVSTKKNEKSLTKQTKQAKEMSGKMIEAYNAGLVVAEKAKEKGVKEVVFDRGSYAYHGRVKALAEGARKGGLKF